MMVTVIKLFVHANLTAAGASYSVNTKKSEENNTEI
jgi:hypothetical protein